MTMFELKYQLSPNGPYMEGGEGGERAGDEGSEAVTGGGTGAGDYQVLIENESYNFRKRFLAKGKLKQTHLQRSCAAESVCTKIKGNFVWKKTARVKVTIVCLNLSLLPRSKMPSKLIILICISTDIGGYTFGKLFKGPKLTKISPNKTYSGMIGSFFLSIISVLLYESYVNNGNNPFWNSYWPEHKLLIYAILISFVSQIGDLVISYFKRKSKIKNTGKIIPGHGGLLDRIDGMIFAIPFAFILFKLL